MSELAAQNVCFAYGNRPLLLDNVSFSVRTGETIVIIGGNAGGKTTLLRIMAGMFQPSTGGVYIDSNPVFRQRARIGLLFQNPDHQMIAATVEEEIALGLELRGIQPDVMRKIVNETLKKFGLEKIRIQSPEQLSGGQKQRAALAAIMVMQPDFLLLDEPDSFLDAPSRRLLMDAVNVIGATTGIVWTTSHPRKRPPANRLFLLEGGRIRMIEPQLLDSITADMPD